MLSTECLESKRDRSRNLRIVERRKDRFRRVQRHENCLTCRTHGVKSPDIVFLRMDLELKINELARSTRHRKNRDRGECRATRRPYQPRPECSIFGFDGYMPPTLGLSPP